jgi:hypothetical protein
MNPIRWRREHQVAGIAICLIGVIAGVFFAWMQSPFQTLASRSASGEWSDYSGLFLKWLVHAHYWPWPVMGASVAGLAFYAVHLLRTPIGVAATPPKEQTLGERGAQHFKRGEEAVSFTINGDNSVTAEMRDGSTRTFRNWAEFEEARRPAL